jgi:hypothetical protein
VRQTLYSILALRMGRTRLYQRLERLVPPTLGFPLNTFDIMQVIAEYAPESTAPQHRS